VHVVRLVTRIGRWLVKAKYTCFDVAVCNVERIL